MDVITVCNMSFLATTLCLLAETLIPNETMYEDVDWIIGNHADELAPWVPIIASRSKPLTRYIFISRNR